MLEGLMQHDHPLTLQHILDRMRRLYRDSEVVTSPTRARRARVLRRGLPSASTGCATRSKSLGIERGRPRGHVRLELAAPPRDLPRRAVHGRGAPHAQHPPGRASSSPTSRTTPRTRSSSSTTRSCRCSRRSRRRSRPSSTSSSWATATPGSLPNVLRYEELLAEQPDDVRLPRDRRPRRPPASVTRAARPATRRASSTRTGRTLLHAFGGAASPTPWACSPTDRVLPIVPMFHANAWGIPYAAALTGADLVMPSKFLQAEPLAKLIEAEKVTVAGGVPTIWLDLLNYADANDADLSSLRTRDLRRRGGAAVADAGVRGAPRRAHHPGVGHDRDEPGRPRSPARRRRGRGRGLGGEGEGAAVRCRWSRRGSSDDDGDEVAVGRRVDRRARGARAVDRERLLQRPEGDDKFHDGWLRTGDIASIDTQGYIRITDRAKDVIKSGGEWVSSVDLEGELMAHPTASRRRR